MSKKSRGVKHLAELVEEIDTFIENQSCRMASNPATFRILESHVNNILYKKVQKGEMSNAFFKYVTANLKKYNFYHCFSLHPKHSKERNHIISLIENEIFKERYNIFLANICSFE